MLVMTAITASWTRPDSSSAIRFCPRSWLARSNKNTGDRRGFPHLVTGKSWPPFSGDPRSLLLGGVGHLALERGELVLDRGRRLLRRRRGLGAQAGERILVGARARGPRAGPGGPRRSRRWRRCGPGLDP